MRSQPGALTPARGVQRQREKPEEGNQSQWARGALQSHVLDQVSWREEPDANHHPSRVRELFLEPWLCAEHLHTSSHRIITATFWRVKVKVKSLSRVRLFVTPWTSSLPGFSLYGIFQARVLEWVAISFSRILEWVVISSSRGPS